MSFFTALTRRKRDDGVAGGESQLARVLTTFDLVALGVGSTLGVGIYVVAGGVAKELAGPGVLLSFFLAAIVTAFAGMSYAEFGARVPKAGSAYIYSYYTVGEFIAFIIGWSLILEYAIGAASVAKGISSYIDSLTNFVIRDAFTDFAPLHAAFLSTYVDFFAMSLCLLLSTALAFGVKESSVINTVFTSINVAVVIFFIFSGLFKVDPHNWNITKEEIPVGTSAGEGGFLPFGISGVLRGAAICFYGFVGFDCISTTGEEVRNPQRAIPIAIIISLSVILAAYIGVSTVITLMVPYYLEDVDAPILHAYDYVGWPIGKYVVGIGALFGLFASLFGALFPLPRVIYAMASDGLLFNWLGQIHPRYQTPLIGTIVSGIATSLLAAIFDLQQLVGLNAIGTLLTYSLVSICVVILRFQQSDADIEDLELSEQSSLLQMNNEDVRWQAVLRHFFSFRRLSSPTPVTSRLIVHLVVVFCILSTLISTTLEYLKDDIYFGSTYAVFLLSTLVAITLIVVISMAIQPASKQKLSFKMPLVPFLPCLGIFANIHLMVVLDSHTWIRFLATIILGFLIYFGYGIRKSKLGISTKKLSFSDDAKRYTVYTS